MKSNEVTQYVLCLRTGGRIIRGRPYHTEYEGWAVTARIPVKFSTAHGKS